jgi:two-component system, sensor histidine kinase PhcS
MLNVPVEFRDAYEEHERRVILGKNRLGCWLGIVLGPLFSFLDYQVYPKHALPFLRLRLAVSVLMTVWFFVLGTRFGKKYYHLQGIIILFVPSAFVAWTVYETDGTASPYYAGLTLVLMVLAVVLDWPIWQSILSVALVLFLYLTACFFSHAPPDTRLFVNNLFFLVSSGIAIIAGTYFHTQLRIHEFISRFELDKNRKALEFSLAQLKENEAQLVHSEKLASLGRMSAGMIHEINNPLNFTTTALFTLRKKGKFLPSEQQKDFAETLKDVEEGVGRVKTIVSDLRVFTRPDSEERAEVSIEEVVAPALRFLNIERKDEVQIEQELSPNLKIWANKNKLIHVLANLLQNSLDALKAKTFTDEKPTIRVSGREKNGVCILTIHDNGPGIPETHLQKIFDPFFTTKDVGSGMGLGLSICYRLVQETQGKISVKTEVGKFCEFTLEFPARKTNPTII